MRRERLSNSRISSCVSCLRPSTRPPGPCVSRGFPAAWPRPPTRHIRGGSWARSESKVGARGGVGVERRAKVRAAWSSSGFGRLLRPRLGARPRRSSPSPCGSARRAPPRAARSSTEVSRPNWPMASRSAPVSPSTAFARQKPKVACALNAAMPARHLAPCRGRSACSTSSSPPPRGRRRGRLRGDARGSAGRNPPGGRYRRRRAGRCSCQSFPAHDYPFRLQPGCGRLVEIGLGDQAPELAARSSAGRPRSRPAGPACSCARPCPACTPAISAVSSALTRRLIRQLR